MGFAKDDPTARRRRSPDQALKDAREIVKRHRRGEHLRPIAAALGLSKTTVERVIKDFRRAQAQAGHDVEQAALLSKLGGPNCLRDGQNTSYKPSPAHSSVSLLRFPSNRGGLISVVRLTCSDLLLVEG